MFDVKRALAEIDEIAGSKVTIEGLFYHNGVKGYLKDSDDQIIDLVHPDLLDKLAGKLSCYVGGKILYHENVQIEGRIDIRQDGVPFLHEIESMKAFYDDEITYVIGGAD